MDKLQTIADYLRAKVFDICLKASDGHIGGSSGAVELLTALYFGGVLRFDPADSDHSGRDFVSIRGHIGPLRYAIFELFSWLKEEELDTYRVMGSRLAGHEDHHLTPGVDISPSGSLGMLLSYGAGAAYALRKQGSDQRFFVFLGDGEEQEGSVSEAARSAAGLQLGNVITIIDRNGKQLSDPVGAVDPVDLEAVWSAYGWNVVSLCDGHSLDQVMKAYQDACAYAQPYGKPTVIIADTVKGYGIDGCREHFSGYHTMSTLRLDLVQAEMAKQDLSNLRIAAQEAVAQRLSSIPTPAKKICKDRPAKLFPAPGILEGTANNPDYCQISYFSQLKARLLDGGQYEDLYFLTADTTRKDTVDKLGLRDFADYLNLGIREQHTVSFAFGIGFIDPTARIIFNTFDAFIYRSLDQINALCQGRGNIVILAENCGLTNSTNGKTHQTSGQPGAILMHPKIHFLEPWDSHSTFECLNWALERPDRGCVYIRIGRYDVGNTTPLSRAEVSSGSGHFVFESNIPEDVVIVSSGLGVDSSISAARLLSDQGIGASVYSVIRHGEFDSGLLNRVRGKLVVTVYNGTPDVLRYPLAGALIGARVLPKRLIALGFTEGATGSLTDLLSHYRLDGQGISETIAQIISPK